MIQSDASKMTVLAPSWVMKAIKRNHLLPNVLFDLKQLKQICSREDLYLTYCMNQDPSMFLGAPSVGDMLVCAWRESDKQEFETILATQELYQGLKEPRFYADNQAAVSGGEASSACTAFEIVVANVARMTDPGILVIIHPGMLGENRTKLQEECRRAYLKQLYVFLNARQVARSEVFGRFVADV